jgi:uncharacterized protein YndB with AHSA1/START domain
MRGGTSTPAGSKITVERTYGAQIEELWALWTTAEGFASWWGPEGFRVEVGTLEACVGGALHYHMIAETPEMIRALKQMGRPASQPARARFTELRPYERLAITSLIDFLPGVHPYENTIAVDFRPLDKRVRMVVTLEPMHDEAFTKVATMGFTSQITKLDRRFRAEQA